MTRLVMSLPWGREEHPRCYIASLNIKLVDAEVN
jgi:hypothetical protein